MCRICGPFCFCYCGLKTKGFLYERDVVINGLWNTDHRNFESPSFGLFTDCKRTALCSISSYAKKNSDLHLFQGIYHDPSILVAP